MIVKINNIEYKIFWHYDNLSTICVMERLDDNFEVSRANIKLNIKDTYNRETARKSSLAKLLRNTFTIRETRKIFWEAFRTMTKKPKW